MSQRWVDQDGPIAEAVQNNVRCRKISEGGGFNTSSEKKKMAFAFLGECIKDPFIFLHCSLEGTRGFSTYSQNVLAI